MKVIEFLGMPRAGKTTAIEIMESYFKHEGKRVRVVYEGARVSPLDKSDRYNYNAWSFHNTVNRILEARLDHYDFILVDRGILDHFSFLEAITKHKDATSAKEYYLSFLNLQDKEIFFSINPEEAIKREKKHKPFLGRVFNKLFLEQLLFSYNRTIDFARSNLCRKLIHIDGTKKFEDNYQEVIRIAQTF
ncbi:MAG: hypothetical protein Q8L29_04085 [archaeon]|nr:hypothetical protein [archaeon]